MAFVERSPLGWVELEPGWWYASADDRFEVWHVRDIWESRWVAADRARPETFAGTRLECEEWCLARRAEG